MISTARHCWFTHKYSKHECKRHSSLAICVKINNSSTIKSRHYQNEWNESVVKRLKKKMTARIIKRHVSVKTFGNICVRHFFSLKFLCFFALTHQKYRVFNLHFNSKVKVPIPVPVWFTFFHCGFLYFSFSFSSPKECVCGQIWLCQLLIQLVYMRSTRIAATTNWCVNATTYDCISKTLSVCFLCCVFQLCLSLCRVISTTQ